MITDISVDMMPRQLVVWCFLCTGCGTLFYPNLPDLFAYLTQGSSPKNFDSINEVGSIEVKHNKIKLSSDEVPPINN